MSNPLRRGTVPASQLMNRRIGQFYRRVLPARAQGVLADLGCGARPLESAYSTLVDRSVALDWAVASTDVHVDALADLNVGIPLRSASIDVVLISDVIEHIAEPSLFLGECRRVLRSGGTLVGNVPFMYWLHAEPHDYFRYTEFGLQHLLATAGFGEVSVEALGGGFDIPIDVTAKIASRIPLVGPKIALALQLLWIVISAPSIMRNERLFRKFPLAYGFVATASASHLPAGASRVASGHPGLP